MQYGLGISDATLFPGRWNIGLINRLLLDPGSMFDVNFTGDLVGSLIGNIGDIIVDVIDDVIIEEEEDVEDDIVSSYVISFGVEELYCESSNSFSLLHSSDLISFDCKSEIQVQISFPNYFCRSNFKMNHCKRVYQ